MPQNTDEVSEFLKFCYEKEIPLTPRGGGTGLTGGAVPLKGGVISFEKMNKILDIDEINQYVVLEPGVITGDINKNLSDKKLFYPPDPASLDSSTIGGNVATNAGGPKAFKYGVTANYLLQLECVFPNGRIEIIGKRTRKWNTGFNLLKLLCGSEGLLAVFTKIVLKIIPSPEKEILILIGFENTESLLFFAQKILKNKLSPSIIEFIDKETVSLTKEKIKNFLPSESSLLFIGFDGNKREVEYQVERLYELIEKEKIENVFAGIDRRRVDKIWEIRKNLFYETERMGFKVHSEDAGIELKKAEKFIGEIKKLFKMYDKIPYIFGHLGDGNIHINLSYKREEEEMVKEISRKIWDIILKYEGTITAEHGIGFLKREGFKKEISPYLYEVQKKIKNIFDPKGILNPGKMF